MSYTVSDSSGAEDSPTTHPIHLAICSQNLVISVYTYKFSNKLFTVSEGTAQPVAMQVLIKGVKKNPQTPEKKMHPDTIFQLSR